MWAKQSTAATLIVGPILDSTGAEYASAVIGDLSISKNGGTLTALAAAATLTVIANGQYTLVMTTGNLDTLGRLQITCNKSTYQMPPIGLVVVPAMVFDSMVLGTDVLQGDVTQFGGTALTAAAGIPEVKVASIAANAVNASALAADAVTEVQSGLATQTSVDDLPTNAELATALATADDAVLAAIATVQSDTNDIQTRLPAALESGRIAAVLDSATALKIDDILTDTGTTLPAAIAALNNLSSSQVVSALGTGAWATAIPWNAAWDAEVQSEVQDAIEVNNLDHLLKIAVDTNFATTVHLDSVVGHIADNGTTATFVRTTDSLEAIRDNQSSGGGGGDATLAKQTEILAAIQGSEVIQVASPNVSGNLVLTQGDDYDGVANPKASWTVTTDYTSGWTVRLTIRSAADAVIYTNTGSVVSSTVVAVTIAAPTGLTMTGCPGQWQGKFDVELTHSSGKKKTIALGTCYINEDQTR